MFSLLTYRYTQDENASFHCLLPYFQQNLHEIKTKEKSKNSRKYKNRTIIITLKEIATSLNVFKEGPYYDGEK